MILGLSAFVCFLVGAATVLAFAPFELHPLAFLTFAFLIHQWVSAPPRRCLWLGFWFGLGLFGAGVSWVYVSLHQFGGMPAPLAGFATAGVLRLPRALPGGGGLAAGARAGAATRCAPACSSRRRGCCSSGCWCWIFTGFPWLAVGYAAAGWPLQGYAPLGGVYALSFLTVSIAGMLWLIVQRRPVFVLVAILAVRGWARRCATCRGRTPAGEPVSVALLQGNIEQEMKFRPERYARILETYAQLAEGTARAPHRVPGDRAAAVLRPGRPGLPRAPRGRGEAQRRRSAARRPYLGGPEAYFNSVLTLGVSPRQAYHKVHLVPFGEFIPPGFGWVLRWLSIPLSDFSRGAPDQPPLAVAGQRVAVNVCYEDVFGDEIARRAPEATLLVNVSNVAWFGDSLAPAQHLQIARLRAIETGRMHLTATNTGITAAIDRDGRVLERLAQFTEGRLEIAAQGYSGATPYVRLRDWPVVLLSVFIFIAFIVRARRSR